MQDSAFRIAERVQAIDASGIRKVFDLARSIENPINLSIGQPDFPVPTAIKDAACTAIRGDRNGYTPTQGLAELNVQLRAEERANSGRDYAERELLITSGVSGGLFLALLVLIEPGDEVIIPDPYFVMYKHLVRLFGGVPVYLDTYDTGFVPDAERLAGLVTERTRLLLLNSPANPTGRVMDAEVVRDLATVCRRHELAVLSDEIYRSFAYAPVPSIAEHHDQVLVLGGYSKTFAMTGWRLGWAAGPEHVVQAMAKVQQYSFVCAPAIAQYAALACPDVDMAPAIERYRAKRDLMVERLGERFTLASPDGAFYLYVKAPTGWTGSAFAEHCIANRVLVIPGAVFSERDSHFRVCYTVADDMLTAGAEALGRLASNAPT